jgi:hypothetical protein
MNKFDTLYETLLGGLARGKTLEDIAKKHNIDLEDLQKELTLGSKVELEHFKKEREEATEEDKKNAEVVAKDHLFEDPKYYTKLKEMESKDGNP